MGSPGSHGDGKTDGLLEATEGNGAMSGFSGHATAIKHGMKVGIVGGALGAIVMAMYAMVISMLVKEVGFFTPLYHIASSVIEPKAMMTSMEAAGAGDSTHFAPVPALVGLIVHMMVGMAAGAVFGALIGWLRPSRGVTVAAGVAYGLLVMVGNALIALPIVAQLFGGGEAIADMPAKAGWGTFTVEHVLFGLVLGLVVAAKVGNEAGADTEPVAGRAG